MATTPLIGLPYPLGTDPPAGAPQMEALARASEKWVVFRFDSAAQRDSILTAGIVTDGMVSYLRDNDYLYVRKAGAWVRLVDAATGTAVQADQGGTTETWTATAPGTETPSGGLPTRVQAAVTVPDSGLLLVTLSAQMKVSNNDADAFVGFRVKEVSSDTPTAGQIIVDSSANRAARTASVNVQTGSWQTTVNVGAGRAGQTIYVALMHWVTAGNRTGTATARSLTVLPIR